MMTHVLVMFVKTEEHVLLDRTATSVLVNLATQEIDAMVPVNTVLYVALKHLAVHDAAQCIGLKVGYIWFFLYKYLFELSLQHLFSKCGTWPLCLTRRLSCDV